MDPLRALATPHTAEGAAAAAAVCDGAALPRVALQLLEDAVRACRAELKSRTSTTRLNALPDESDTAFKWLELRRLPPIMGFVGSGLRGLVTLLA